MKLKSFFAGTVEAALGLARDELGRDAVLVNSRKAPPEARHLGHYEVVAAAFPEGAAPANRDEPPFRPLETRSPGEPVRTVADPQLRREVADLRRQLERMRKAVWQARLRPVSGSTSTAGGLEVLPPLLEAEVDPQLAQEIAACVEARLAGDPLIGSLFQPWAEVASEEAALRRRECLWAALAGELERRLSVEPELGRPGARNRIAALVGPPGAGKTTTLTKLALVCGLRRRLATQILSLDTYRIAATEPLRTYASILGVGFQPLEAGFGLRQALAEYRSKDLILIDTPGFGPRDEEAIGELASLIGAFPDIDVHLVLAATTQSADLTAAVDRFEVFRPARLLFTRVDETSAFGPAFSQAARTGKPVSFLATGQQVPEDLEEAAKNRVVELLLDRETV